MELQGVRSPMATRNAPTLIPIERIERRILLIRGEKIMLDSDLAELYGVSTKALNQAVKRNRARFPADFMFRLSARGSRRFEPVTICDRFPEAPGSSSPAVRLHRIRCRHALLGPAQRASHSGEHRHHADLRSPTWSARLPRSARPETRSTGRKVRRPVQGCLRCDSSPHGSAHGGTEEGGRSDSVATSRASDRLPGGQDPRRVLTPFSFQNGRPSSVIRGSARATLQASPAMGPRSARRRRTRPPSSLRRR